MLYEEDIDLIVGVMDTTRKTLFNLNTELLLPIVRMVAILAIVIFFIVFLSIWLSHTSKYMRKYIND
ncbi:hypothetical protein ACFV1P_13155 [Staphylococcus warneri]|uniref:hypothetical protein n=1 Tax=Staphylococcus TaxID=1279 RepID=UPI00114D46FF|nr:hypothetical protein [Staphylococcus pasteuri]